MFDPVQVRIRKYRNVSKLMCAEAKSLCYLFYHLASPNTQWCVEKKARCVSYGHALLLGFLSTITSFQQMPFVCNYITRTTVIIAI